MLFTVTSTNGFYSLHPSSISGLKLVCNVNIVYGTETSRLSPETSTKLYVHEFDFWRSNRVRGLQVTIAKYRTLQTQKKDGHGFRYRLYPGLQLR